MRYFIPSLLIIIGIIITTTTSAQNNNSKNDFLGNMLLSDDYAKENKGQEASQDARSILDKQKKRIDVQDNRKLRDIIKKQQKEQKVQSTKATAKQDIKRISQLPAAPFGLLWGETYEETLSSGVILTRADEKDYINSFVATQLPKPLKDSRYVVVTFGEENKLWRIISYGVFIKDKPDASIILKEYYRYFDLLAKKYGHEEQIYNPKITKITKSVDDGFGKTKEITELKEEPIGNPHFLAQLESGEADLYASFYNNEVGAALSINADGNGNTYLIIEYKNLRLFKQQQDETLDAL